MNKYYYNFLIIFILSFSFIVLFSFNNSYALPKDKLKIINAKSNQDVARYSSKSQEESFYTINTINGKTTNGDFTDLAYGDTYKEVVGEETNNNKKKQLIKEYLADTDLYSITDKSNNSIEVTRLYSNLRIRVNTNSKKINSYGAISGLYYKNYYLFTYNDEISTKNAYQKLVNDYGALNVILDIPIKANSVGWGTNYMNFGASYLKPSIHTPITIAVLDTGINRNHDIFTNTNILSGINLIDPNKDETDDRGHGTAVAGIIAESINKDISILPIKVLDNNGIGTFQDILNGLDYAESQGVDIANLSLAVNLADIYPNHNKDVIYDNIAAIERIFSKYKMLMVCSSGNDGLSNDNVFSYPAISNYTISVGSIDKDEKMSDFSNYGSTLDFVAPGRELIVADHTINNAFREAKGTSFSAPYISAAAARIKNIHNNYTNDNIKYYLVDIAKDLGTVGKDKYYGYGVPIFKNKEIKDIDNRFLEQYNLSLNTKEFTYTGNEIKPVVTIKDKSGNILNTKYYDVKYSNNINAGIGIVTVTGKNKYYGSLTELFKISPANINYKITTNLLSKYTYTGKSINPTINIYRNKVLVNKNNYDIKYINNKNIGISTIIVNGKNNFNGKYTKSFIITPKKPVITTLSRFKKKVGVVWKKSGNSPIYYKIKYKKVGTNKWYTKTTTKNSIKIKRLKPNTKYYIKIKAYKKIKNKTYKSSYSNIIKFKTH